MVKDGPDREVPSSPPPTQAFAVERIIGRKFADDQIDAPTIDPSAGSAKIQG